MAEWDSLWQIGPRGLMLDDNGDGLVDGSGACVVPLTPALFTADVWAGCANFGARIGLESPALRLPLAVDLNAIEPWQTPIFVSALKFPGPLQDTPWAYASIHSVDRFQGGFAAWLEMEGERALWLQAVNPDKLSAVLNAMAASGISDSGGPAQAQYDNPPAASLAHLYSTEKGGLFLPGADGFTPSDTRVRLLLHPDTDLAGGCAAIDLAARIGLETAGATLPLALAADTEMKRPHSGATIYLGKTKDADRECCLTSEREGMSLGPRAARYLARTYPYLSEAARLRVSEPDTVSALTDSMRHIANGHPPAVKLALAQVQAGDSLRRTAGRDEGGVDLVRQVFRHQWDTPDGEDNVSRIRRLAQEIIIPYVKRRAPRDMGRGSVDRSRLTLFCSAPLEARRLLSEEIEGVLALSNRQIQLRVLPVHKSALAWVQEEQIALLSELDPASVDLYFTEFRPNESTTKWLDLPTRWLQEWFPVKDVVQRSLGLDADSVRLHMMPPDEPGNQSEGMLRAYRLEARDESGHLLHGDELHVLYSERTYLVGMPEYGLVHPSAAGGILLERDAPPHVWHTPTDEEHFWNFYQETILPAIRTHVLDVSGGRPTPDNEPYFERLEVDGFFGWPDESLGVCEEFVSVGEALHEDVYFNTLDYLAAVGEQFCGRPIVAAGQVLPFIHDYQADDGSVVARDGSRAVVTLHAWHVPQRLPGIGLVVGDARDLPRPQRVDIVRLKLDEEGSKVVRVVLRLRYGSKSSATFAGEVFARWRNLAAADTSFPKGVTVELRFVAALQTVRELVLEGSDGGGHEMPADELGADSSVIGTGQLAERLAELADRPEIAVWQVGQSYQGRTGYAVDVRLPSGAGQTHQSRLKLTVQKPTCFIIARHHANEVSSTTAVLDMMLELVEDPDSRNWLQKLNLVFLPMANPDGAAVHYRLMAEHPRWKHHAARFNAAGMEFSIDSFNPDTAFGEARFRREIWQRWLPDAVVDNHGVPSHEWCQPFAGYNSPPRFQVSYHVVQAMIYGIIAYADDPARPGLKAAAESLRSAVSKAVAADAHLHARNLFWLDRYHDYGHRWLPETSPKDVHQGMLFFFRGMDRREEPVAWRSFSLRHPEITLIDWITEVPDETAQGTYLVECAGAHRTANLAMMRLVADSAQPAQRLISRRENGDVHVLFMRERRIEAV